jgi:pimeloyl-ACP methyl ester carboxylesterase
MPNDFATAQFILKNIKRNDSSMNFEFKFNLNVLKLSYQNIISYVPTIGFDKKVLFLAGEKSDYITSSTTIHLFDLYPNAEIEIIKNAGHWIHAENPTEVYEKVNAFINK